MIILENEKAYSTMETAAILERRPTTIRKYIKDGKLTCTTIANAYYIKESALKEFIQKRG